MADSKYFGIPFATSGDKATIPEATQPSGAISFTQGYGPDYERDPETDPLAKRVPRDETNELYFQVTNALKFLQLYGTPEWYAVDDAGNTVSYPLSARVRHDAGAGMQVWRSIVASNTATPGSDATKWTLDNPFDIATLEATLAEALAGTIGTKLITPRRLASASQRGAWNYAQAAGTANAWTVTLAPAPSALAVGMTVKVKVATPPTGALTLDVNGLGASNVVKGNGDAITNGYFVANEIVTLTYDGSVWRAENTVRRHGDTIIAPNSTSSALALSAVGGATAPAFDITYSGSPFRAFVSEDGMVVGARSPTDRSQYFFAGPGGARGANYMTEDASPVWTVEVYDTAGNPVGTKGFLSLRGGTSGVASFGITLGGNNIAQFTSASLGLRSGGNQSISLAATSASISCDGTGVGSNAAGVAVTRPATTAGSAPFAYVAASSLRFYVDEGGGLHSTSGSIAVISDSYFKENISDLPTALDHINALRPVTYRLKDDDETRATRVGFIAQEVQQVMPLLVTEDDKIDAGGRSALTLNMGDMVPYLVKAVQELSARVTDLEAQLAKN